MEDPWASFSRKILTLFSGDLEVHSTQKNYTDLRILKAGDLKVPEELIKNFLDTYLGKVVLDGVWKPFIELLDTELENGEKLLHFAKSVYKLTRGLFSCLELFNDYPLYLEDRLFQYQSGHFFPICCSFLQETFEAYCTRSSDNNSTSCASELELQKADITLQLLREIVEVLSSLRLTHRVFGVCSAEVAQKAISARMENIRKRFAARYLPPLLAWVRSTVVSWLTHLYRGYLPEPLPRLELSLFSYTYHSFGLMRIEEIFDIIVDYDSEDHASHPALEDLKECLHHTDLKDNLIHRLKSQNEERLLHHGADTSDIITHLQQLTAALRFIDPSGAVLKAVQGDIHSYLRLRPDASRCLINTFVDNDQYMTGILSALPAEDESDSDWEPEPRVSYEKNSYEATIYGSKERFAADYHAVLAETLLLSENCDLDKELRNLELLKARFGEDLFLKCTVMLEDVAESRRLNAILGQRELPLQTLIISKLFWPSLHEELFSPPLLVKRWLSQFDESFQKIKAARCLSYLMNYGTVELELVFGNKTFQYCVSPLLATIIIHFKENDKISSAELATLLAVPPHVIKRKIAFWVNEGVLIEVGDSTYEINQLGPHSPAQTSAICFERDAAIPAEPPQEAEDLELCWKFVVGMLTNIGAMSLKRIYSMLSMCVGESVPKETAIKTYLQKRVIDGHLEYLAGNYSLTTHQKIPNTRAFTRKSISKNTRHYLIIMPCYFTITRLLLLVDLVVKGLKEVLRKTSC
ncbi:anaphase-promoting complex subunit 2-like isoform X2 [Zophobas morio]|uniref:anaphase-promoting complex subunit 2-like isoform X2 n=1 Tax=Zophobas morio TaxID=2755281 RepID=UPI0030832C85